MTCVFVCVKLIKRWYQSGSVLVWGGGGVCVVLLFWWIGAGGGGDGGGGWGGGGGGFNQLTQGRKHAGQ